MRPPEAARERDLQRYYQPWLDAQSLIDASDGKGKGLTYEGFQPQKSRDKVLTAFAQLAALRLDARRAMISLIDSSRQYVLAEATKTLSLFSHRSEWPEDEMWLGHATIARFDAVCHHTFTSTYEALEQDGSTYTADALVVPDCRLDPRFSERDYVKGEPGVRFYAGVPIVTKAGHQIGVYAVSDDNPRKSVSAIEMRFMQEVAEAVMEHLELAKDSDDRIKGERMIKGLTEFIERSSSHEARNEPSTMEKQTENARLESLAEEDSGGSVSRSSRQQVRKRATERPPGTSRIFQRAARIMRQSTSADGVVFFDTSAAGIKGHAYEIRSPTASSDESRGASTTDFDTAGSSTSAVKKRSARERFGKNSTSSADPTVEARGFAPIVPAVNSKPCEVVGFSIRTEDHGIAEKDFCFTEAAMERYIQRYPFGKFFNFNEDGTSLNSSEEISGKSEAEQSDKSLMPRVVAQKPKRRRDGFVPGEFLKVLPNVRSLIFLPIWDPLSEKWVAGGFIWTTKAGRLMSPETELPYLRAFGNTICSEVARATAQKSDRAKTTFIASISHELRSPLHGILGSVEFLHDTVSSAQQRTLVSTIETCGKTLLDTIDHVLDYAKINKLRDASSRRKQRSGNRSNKVSTENSILGVTTDFNLAQLVEEVCETVCAGHTFYKSHSANSAFHDQSSGRGETPSKHDSRDSDVGPVPGAEEGVAVTVNVTPFVNWTIRSQPGAYRRIVMNLLGNALKYTDSGFIKVSLGQQSSHKDSMTFLLLVQDSGRGMSSEYQRTKLFAPFSQENPFASGTGLGLSIVKQIVESMKGEIHVESTLDVGTTIKVSMKVPTGQADVATKDQALPKANQALKHHSASICFLSERSRGRAGERIRESIRNSCDSFGITLSEDLDWAAATKPDFLFTEPASLEQLFKDCNTHAQHKTRLAVICICTDATEKADVERRFSGQFATLGWTVGVIAQPCGPKKLAEVLVDCKERNTEQQGQHSKFLDVPKAGMNSSTALLNEEPPLVHRSRSDTAFETMAVDPSAVPKDIEPTSSLTEPASRPLPVPMLPPGIITPPRVLLVDDNAINLRLLTVFATRQSLPYNTATNGSLALQTFRDVALTTSPPSRPFDYVLMDLSMPVMDGLESTRRIRKFEEEMGLEKSCIVALTGLASAQDQLNARDAGMDLYLVKPVKFGDIERLVAGRREVGTP